MKIYDFKKPYLKAFFRDALLDIMKVRGKNATAIHSNTSHTPSYVSVFLKEDTNHSIETIENIGRSLQCRVHIEFIYDPCIKPLNGILV